MTAVIAVLSFASAFSLVYWALCPRDDIVSYHERLQELRSARGGAGADPRERAEMALPFHERVIVPIMELAYERILRWAPRGIRQRMSQRLEQAGKPFGVGRYFALKIMAAAGIPLAHSAILTLMGGPRAIYESVHLVACAGLAGYFLPDAYVTRLCQDRKRAIALALPDILDLLTVSVEAGLGFDGAVQKVSEKFGGPAGEEFREYLKEVRLGKPRADALRSLSERVPVDDLKTFVASVIQAEQLGVSLARVLRIQSEQMRLKRKQRAEEHAMQTPVKMLFPLVLFVFPTIFIVLLGPMAIQALTLLSRGR
ncbi:MAG: type II secretion system F family protein [Firmicutes bacterium]|jgi:tight adherence protein C|nr:type II secretion system F family protein [Bacillota bacterium]